MKHNLHLLILFVLFITGCKTAPTTPMPDSHTLTIFAAASLTDAFTEIGESFEAANPSVTVTFNFGGSQTLRTQIEEGAPVDVFASANAKEMDTLVTGSFIASNTPQIFLTNQLVVILPTNNPAGIEKLEDLAKPGIKLVLAAEEVPVGRYSRESFALMDTAFGNDFLSTVLANVVSNEDNVKQVVAKVQLGEADAGIVYTSDSVAAPGLKSIEIPAELNVIAKYPIAPLVNSENTELAQVFVDYILSAEGQAILEKWGFGPIQ
ncbi:MAG: molybdate ABC transporter substrate-binding protein [Anaerolineae bacterium]|nr:molybdate ABC transporter substrate-binding protein [Anaerolineae bacterium]